MRVLSRTLTAAAHRANLGSAELHDIIGEYESWYQAAVMGYTTTRRRTPLGIRTWREEDEEDMKWLLAVLFLALPLQWFRVDIPVVGPQRFHIAVALVVGAIAITLFRPTFTVKLMQLIAPAVFAIGAYFAIWASAAFHNGQGMLAPVQQLGLAVAALGLAGVSYRAVIHPEGKELSWMRWAGLLTSVATVAAMSYSLAANGVNPAAVFRETIVSANPDILQRELFYRAFVGFGLDAETTKSNLRHEVFGAVFISMCVALAAARLRPFARRWQQHLFRLSMVMCTVLVLLSLSRSVMIALGFMLVLVVAALLRRGGVTSTQVRITVSAAGLMLALYISGFFDVVWGRFATDTKSYTARSDLLRDAFLNLEANIWTGGVPVAGASSHNFVIDSGLRGGIGLALAALAVFLCVAAWWWAILQEVGRRGCDWAVPICAGVSLPLIRMFTAGGGLIPPVQWLCLGLMCGLFLGISQVADPEVDRADARGMGSRATAGGGE